MTSNTMTNPTDTPVAAPAAAARIRYVNPTVSIHEDADGYTIEADLPGVAKDAVQVTVETGELVFTGTRTPAPAGHRIHGEIVRADYHRVFDLDPAVDPDRITARLDQGVLVLRLPKAPDKKPRRISVTD